VKVGERLQGCEKCQGRKAGEPMVRLCVVEVVSVRREPLRNMTDDPAYGNDEVEREGFPEMTPEAFVEFFCDSHAKCTPDTTVTRIEFRYVPDVAKILWNPETHRWDVMLGGKSVHASVWPSDAGKWCRRNGLSSEVHLVTA
jgi:hypothetical protein